MVKNNIFLQKYLTALVVNGLLKKNSIIDVRLGSKYAEYWKQCKEGL